MQHERQTCGLVVVDHGSRRAESNQALERIVSEFGTRFGWAICEPAHMELAEPTIAMAFDRCVARGAKFVIVHPFFLLPGRHWTEDIPKLTAQAASAHPGIGYQITEPLGCHAMIMEVMQACIDQGVGRNPTDV